MARIVARGYEDFLGGMLSALPSNELNVNHMTLVQNAVVTNRLKMGQLSKRKGRSAHYTGGATSGAGIVDIHNFTKHDGTEYLIYAYDDGTDIQIRQRTGASASTLIYTASGAAGGEVSLITASTDYAIFAVEGDTYQRWDGSTVTSISPPTNMDTGVMVEHQGRLWGSDSNTKNNLRHSAIMNESDWTTSTSAATYRMRMPNIVGVCSCGDSGLVVCSEYQTAVIVGNSFNTYEQRSISGNYGCKSYKSMVSFGSFCLFLSHDNVILANASGFVEVGGAIKDYIDGMTEAAKLGAKAFSWEQFYILCYDSDADSTVDTALVYDTQNKVWSIFTNHSICAGTRAKDSTHYVAIQGTDNIDKYWDTYGDRGTSIAFSATSRGYDAGRFFSRKTARRAYLQSVAPGSTINVAVQLIADGTNTGSTENYDVNSEQGVVHPSDACTGNILQFNLANTSTDGPIDITGVLFLMNEMAATGEVM